MRNPVLERLARENPVPDMPPLPFDEIAARIDAAAPAGSTAVAGPRARGARPGRRLRAARPGRARRPLPSAAWPAGTAAVAAAAAAAVLVATSPAGHPRAGSGTQSHGPATATATLAAHFAVLRSAPGAAPPPPLAARIAGALHGPPAEVRRVVSAAGPVWIAVGADGRLCVTLTVAGRTETLAISCASEAQAIRLGVRVAGRIGTSTRYVAGVVPDRISHVAVGSARGGHLVLVAHDNVYSATVRAGSPAA